jgi:hypothetical protein
MYRHNKNTVRQAESKLVNNLLILADGGNRWKSKNCYKINNKPLINNRIRVYFIDCSYVNSSEWCSNL